MKRSKPIIIKLDPANYPLKRVTRHLSATQRRLFKKAVAQQCREIRYHFKKWGWGLDWEMIKDEVFGTVFGSELSTHLLAQVMTASRSELIMNGNAPYLQKRSHDPKSRSKRVKKRPTSQS